MAIDFRKKHDFDPAKDTYMTVIYFKNGEKVFGHFNIALGDKLDQKETIRLHDVKEGGIVAFKPENVSHVTQIDMKHLPEE